jgi:hypothetical protein
MRSPARLLIVGCACVSVAVAGQSSHDVELHAPGVGDAATLQVTINPEARVSVKRIGALPAPAPCGTPLAIPVSIVNHGFFTGSLEATWTGSPVEGGTLSWAPLPMSGAPREMRVLHVTWAQPGQVDVTIAFKARGDRPDLDGRDRVHLLLTCRDRKLTSPSSMSKK